MTARKDQRKGGMTLSEAMAAYWTGRGDVTEDYRNNALRGLSTHLSDLMPLPIGRELRGMTC